MIMIPPSLVLIIIVARSVAGTTPELPILTTTNNTTMNETELVNFDNKTTPDPDTTALLCGNATPMVIAEIPKPKIDIYRTAELLLENIDQTTNNRPCENFFKYACANGRKIKTLQELTADHGSELYSIKTNTSNHKRSRSVYFDNARSNHQIHSRLRPPSNHIVIPSSFQTAHLGHQRIEEEAISFQNIGIQLEHSNEPKEFGWLTPFYKLHKACSHLIARKQNSKDPDDYDNNYKDYTTEQGLKDLWRKTNEMPDVFFAQLFKHTQLEIPISWSFDTDQKIIKILQPKTLLSKNDLKILNNSTSLEVKRLYMIYAGGANKEIQEIEEVLHEHLTQDPVIRQEESEEPLSFDEYNNQFLNATQQKWSWRRYFKELGAEFMVAETSIPNNNHSKLQQLIRQSITFLMDSNSQQKYFRYLIKMMPLREWIEMSETKQCNYFIWSIAPQTLMLAHSYRHKDELKEAKKELRTVSKIYLEKFKEIVRILKIPHDKLNGDQFEQLLDIIKIQIGNPEETMEIVKKEFESFDQLNVDITRPYTIFKDLSRWLTKRKIEGKEPSPWWFNLWNGPFFNAFNYSIYSSKGNIAMHIPDGYIIQSLKTKSLSMAAKIGLVHHVFGHELVHGLDYVPELLFNQSFKVLLDSQRHQNYKTCVRSALKGYYQMPPFAHEAGVTLDRSDLFRETFADLIGLEVALNVYDELKHADEIPAYIGSYINNHDNTQNRSLSPEKTIFLFLAQHPYICSKYNDEIEVLYEQMNDLHLVSQNRLNFMLVNNYRFQQAYQCKDKGGKMTQTKINCNERLTKPKFWVGTNNN